jgi:plasmid stabilization system protein ParE
MPVAYRTQLADEDLRSIALQIGIESGRPLAADQIIDELVDRCDQLAALSSISQLGTLVPELGQGVRLQAYRRWVIIFRYFDEGVLILRVVDGSQDYMSWKFA